MRRAVFLDRDGVINRAVVRDGRPYPPASLAELEVLPDVARAIAALRERGFAVIVVTNQPDVANGRQERHVVEAMHALLRARLALDDIKVCYHVDADRCSCRKPKPGMLVEAAAEHELDLHDSYMVGDRWRDIEAGRAAGCRTILVGGGYEERKAESPDAAVASLWEASQLILAHETSWQ